MTAEASTNNTLTRAREAIANNEECDKERMTVLLDTIVKANAGAASIHAQREALKAQASEHARVIEAAYEELEGLLPANPLGNLNIGAV